MSTLIDTNVLIDLLDPKSDHHKWAVKEFTNRKIVGPAIICDIVYCEFSAGMEKLEDVDSAIRHFALDRMPYSNAALFSAAKVFRRYKNENKGPKNTVLPDFLIGALAEATGLPLMTANARDYKTYFKGLNLIVP